MGSEIFLGLGELGGVGGALAQLWRVGRTLLLLFSKVMGEEEAVSSEHPLEAYKNSYMLVGEILQTLQSIQNSAVHSKLFSAFVTS